MSLAKSAIDKVIAKFGTGQIITAAVAEFETVSTKPNMQPTLARVIVSTSVPAERDALEASVSRLFVGKAVPVVGSFRKITSGATNAYYGFVRLNRVTRPYDDASLKTMKPVHASLLMDNEDKSLWEVRADAAGNKMLARQAKDDLSQLLESAHVRNLRTPQLASVSTAPGYREFCAFVDPNTESVRFGYIIKASGPDDEMEVLVNPMLDDMYGDVNQGLVINEPSEADRNKPVPTAVSVDTAMLIESAYVEEADAEQFNDNKLQNFQLPTGVSEAEKLKYYYGALYSYNKSAQEYYAMIAEQIDQHVAL